MMIYITCIYVIHSAIQEYVTASRPHEESNIRDVHITNSKQYNTSRHGREEWEWERVSFFLAIYIDLIIIYDNKNNNNGLVII